MIQLNRVHQGDCRAILAQIPSNSVQCCVTSPPYLGLRDYGVDGQIGLEADWREHVGVLLGVFLEVRRVLHPTGTLWVNYGDAYAQGGKQADAEELAQDAQRATERGYQTQAFAGYAGWNRAAGTARAGLKPKDLMGLPWRLALALQEAGWWLRADCIWHKPSPLPESVRDRPSRDHEYVFLLSKCSRYFYDPDAVRVPNKRLWTEANGGLASSYSRSIGRKRSCPLPHPGGRNLRTVWTVQPEPCHEAHFATYPRGLVRPCLQAGTSRGGCCPTCRAPWAPVYELGEHDEDWQRACGATEDPEHGLGYKGRATKAYPQSKAQTPGEVKARILAGLRPRKVTRHEPSCSCGGDPIPCLVLDPFAGSGTTGIVAAELGCSFLGAELNPEYARFANERVAAAYSGLTLREHRAGQGSLFGQETQGAHL